MIPWQCPSPSTRSSTSLVQKQSRPLWERDLEKSLIVRSTLRRRFSWKAKSSSLNHWRKVSLMNNQGMEYNEAPDRPTPTWRSSRRNTTQQNKRIHNRQLIKLFIRTALLNRSWLRNSLTSCFRNCPADSLRYFKNNQNLSRMWSNLPLNNPKMYWSPTCSQTKKAKTTLSRKLRSALASRPLWCTLLLRFPLRKLKSMDLLKALSVRNSTWSICLTVTKTGPSNSGK